jgi:single-stranded-DNA-specific exonuclease
MSKTLGISKIASQILANRNVRTKNAAIKYLNPKLEFLRDTLKMRDAGRAIEIILQSIKNKDKIAVYGDYDVDGVSSLVILVKALRALGAETEYYIPHRETEGYGLNKESVVALKDSETDLLITCDNGVSSIEEVRLAKLLGMKVIVIDHHVPGLRELEDGTLADVLPPADAIINPKRRDCEYPFKNLCAAGICYKFARELYRAADRIFDPDNEFLIFAAIATYCDVVDLVDENRILLKNGIDFINKRVVNVGLKALIRQKSLKKIGEFEIGYVLGPCVNASGRLSRAVSAVELFLTDDEKLAAQRAKSLSDLNEERKTLTALSVERAANYLFQSENAITPVIVIYDPEIRESVAGIVAGRIKDIFFHPVIVLTESEEATALAKGSARSIEGYNIFDNLYANRDLFHRFGGHSMAAGLSIKIKNIETLRERLNSSCELKEEDFSETVSIDYELDLSEATFKLCEELLYLAPFGKGNRDPLFLTRDVFVTGLRVIEKKNTILFNFGKIRGVCFGKVKYFQNALSSLRDEGAYDKIVNNNLGAFDNLCFDLVYSLFIDDYNNNFSVKLRIKDFIINRA